MEPRVIAFIFARGGSKGVPRKNIRLLAGKPLIAYSIEAGLASSLVDRVVVSTEDEEIADVARRHGAEVPFMRPAELAQDNSPEWLAWQHACKQIQDPGSTPDDYVFVSIPTTSPLRTVEDIDSCIHKLLETDADLVITVAPARRNPYFNMVVIDGDDYARLVLPPKKALVGRQHAPQVYDMTGSVYAARWRFVLEARSWLEGKVKAIVVPEGRSVDIDTELDLEIAEFLMKKNQSILRG